MRHHHHYHHRQRFSVPLGWGRKVYTGYGFAGFIGWLIVAEFALLWFVLVAYYFILRYIFWGAWTCAVPTIPTNPRQLAVSVS